MTPNQELGKNGEIEVVEKVPCPNCGKKLMQLPDNYPLFDVQCVACSFRAQVKTTKMEPSGEIDGAGWDVMDKVLKAGYLVPYLIVNFKLVDRQEIRFYPFLNRKNLKMRRLPPTAKRANYAMFDYVGLDKMAYILLYPK